MAEKELPSKKETSMLQDMGSWAYENYIKPKSIDFAHQVVSGLLGMVADTLLVVVDRAFYGENYKEHSSKRNGTSQTPYDRMFTGSTSKSQDPWKQPVYSVPVRVDSYEKAKRVYDELVEIIVNCGNVKVGQLYEMQDIQKDTSSNDWRYGWKNIEDIHYKIKGGWYVFDMPRPVELKK